MEREYITIPKGGRPCAAKFPGADIIRDLYMDQNHRAIDIAKKYNVSVSTVNRWIKEAGCNCKRGRAPQVEPEPQAGNN